MKIPVREGQRYKVTASESFKTMYKHRNGDKLIIEGIDGTMVEYKFNGEVYYAYTFTFENGVEWIPNR